ncbi:MAG: hypothetical protein F2663_01415 [Actinobacteria bacterium]|jgi:hypothetical protein|uniref:Unannotated protein n=1 Tax=freshwater metagenome TaxID=449393 RepID=A0A6J6NME6_9ZZZZ|nr:hypothetical protein [Actinomycetota bacterium]
MRRGTVLVAFGVLLLAPVARASPGQAENLRIYQGIVTELRTAYLAICAPKDRAACARETAGPLVGRSCHTAIGDPQSYCGTYRIFYGRYRGKEYAVADFWGRHTGGTDQPIRFARAVGGSWRYVGDSGDPSSCGVPDAVASVWAWHRCTA